MQNDPNNLLQKYNISVPGADKHVMLKFYENQHKVILIFTGIYNVGDILVAKEKLSRALPEELKADIIIGETHGDFSVCMSPRTYEKLIAQKLERGAALAR